MADEIGVFYTPALRIPRAWHAGVYCKRNYGSRLNQVPEIVEAFPERMPDGLTSIFAAAREKILGERHTDTPFGRLMKSTGFGFPEGALHDPLVVGIDIGHLWQGIHDSFAELDGGDYLYHPILQNSNSVVAAALSRNGIAWTPMRIWANPRDPRRRPGDPPYTTDPNYPWVPGADRPLIRDKDVQRPTYALTPMGDVTGFPQAIPAHTGRGIVSGMPMRFSPVRTPLFGVE